MPPVQQVTGGPRRERTQQQWVGSRLLTEGEEEGITVS